MKLQDILDEIFEETTNEDLRNWFKKKWVNIGKKDKSGKHPPCGTSGKKRGEREREGMCTRSNLQ